MKLQKYYFFLILMGCLSPSGFLRAAPSPDTLSLINEHINMAESLVNKEKFHQAMTLYNEALSLAGLAGLEQERGRVTGRMGVIYMLYQADYSRAMENFISALKIAEKYKNKNEISRNYNNIGSVNYFLGKYSDAMSYYRKALQMLGDTDDPQARSRYMNNIALIYSTTRNADSALLIQNQIMDLAVKRNDISMEAMARLSRGDLYFNMSLNGKAVSDYIIAVKLFQQLNDLIKLTQAYLHLGNLRYREGNFGEAGSYYDKALDIAKKIQSKGLLMASYSRLTTLYSTMGDYRRAYELQNIYNVLKDSVFNEKKLSQINEMQIRYESEKKQQENQVLRSEARIRELEIRRQTMFRNYAMVLAALMGGLILLVYSRYRIKIRSNRLLEQKNSELEVLNATKDKFFSIIAHDLRNPMGPLVSLTERVTQDHQAMNPSSLEQSLTVIHKSVTYLYDLLDKLLQWSMSQQGKLQLRYEKFSAAEVVNNVISNLALLQLKKDISIINEIDPEQLIETDQRIFETVFRNLISNAVKFSDQSGRVIIRADHAVEGSIRFLVIDQGIGIDKEDIARLFSIGTDHRKIGYSKEKGTGLGLIISSEFIRKLGGTISVESVAGKGSTFYFTIPLRH